MRNFQIRQLEDDLIKRLNLSDLDIEVKRLIVKNVYNLVEKEADKVITEELSQPITEYGEMKDAESTRCE